MLLHLETFFKTDLNWLLGGIIHRVWVMLRHFRLRMSGMRIRHQDFRVSTSSDLIRLGNANACWSIQEPSDGLILSLGVGLDMSFDIELAKLFGRDVVLVDPTPRAIEHFQSVMDAFADHSKNCSYELKGLRPSQFKLVEKAIWDESGSIEFFLPKNPDHVSHSIVNFQHNYDKDTESIIVESITMTDLLNTCGSAGKRIALLKMDIEGAEIEVINDMLAAEIFPDQLAVEYDELNFPTAFGISRVKESISNLGRNGYRLKWTSGESDFLFVRQAL